MDKSKANIDMNRTRDNIGVTADGPDDDEDLTPEIKHLRAQLTKFKY